MPIPDYQTVMLPLLKITADQKSHRLDEVVEKISDEFKLSDAERSQLLPSGVTQIINDRVGWARTYLKQAGLIQYPQRGFSAITSRGQEVLKSDLPRIDVKFLMNFPEFVEFRNRTQKNDGVSALTDSNSNNLTPQEAMESAFERIQSALAQDLLQKTKSASPQFFERLVVDLLLAMGYGGSLKEAGKVIGKSGDGGIDGVINEDKLGLDTIYIQAKRWQSVVGRPEIQKFVGALQGVRARKGVFITTSNFTSDAKNYTTNLDTKIVLVDGEMLSDLMIEHNVGVSVQRRLDVKRIDEDYFLEE